MTKRRLDPDAVRDACAFLKATLEQDYAGRMAIAKGRDPSEMVDALVLLHLRLLVLVHPDPAGHLEFARIHAEEFAGSISYVSETDCE